MSHRKKLSILITISIVLLLIGYALIFPEQIGLCEKTDYACIYPKANTIGEPLYFGFIPFILILVFLLFFPKEVFKFWSKFAIVLIPIIIIAILLTPIECTAPLHLCLDKKLITQFLSNNFAILSAILIIIKAILLKRRKSTSVKYALF